MLEWTTEVRAVSDESLRTTREIPRLCARVVQLLNVIAHHWSIAVVFRHSYIRLRA